MEQSPQDQSDNTSGQLHLDKMCQPDGLDHGFGNALEQKANNRTFRVYFQNVNSIKSTRWEKWLHTCTLIKKKEVDLFGIAKIGINPKFPQATEEVSQIAHHNWTHAITTLTNTQQDQRGLPQRGGTSMATTKHWISRVVEKCQDNKLGRWTYHVLRGKNKHQVVFVSAYRICQHRVSGPTTAATQQWLSLVKDGHGDPNPC